MKFIKIESKGIIESGAFTLLGASTKKGDDTKIGFFGSGLKYSIAWLLRNKIEFKVFAEYSEILFTTKSVSFREKEFGVICIDGKETSLTTEMGGSDWKPFSIIRELYCNAIDEGDAEISIVDKGMCVPVEDKTVFYIQVTEQFKEVLDNWDNYFSENRKDLVYSDADFNQIYAGSDKTIIYRKGIRCFYLEQRATFNYDLSWVAINESRVIADDHDFKWKLREFLQKNKDKKVIAQLLNTINKTWEKSFSWQYGSGFYSNTWLEVIGRKALVPYENAGFWSETIEESPIDYLIIPSSMIDSLKERFLDKIRVVGDVEGVSGSGEFRVIEQISKKQQYLLDESVAFLTEAGYIIKYPIKIVVFTRQVQLGQAIDGTILLSEKLFDTGRKEIASCIIEEQEHLVTGFQDESRQFQTHFINKYLTSLEEKIGKFL